LLLPGETVEEQVFYGAEEAVIDPTLCTGCGKCKETCRFGAIDSDFRVDPALCEGCGACTLVCSPGAVTLRAVHTGEITVVRTAHGTFAHAQLDPGAEGSGKLVTQVKKTLGKYEGEEGWALIDGAPGIGCVVISSITGADAVVAVCEPTPSGRTGLERVLDLSRHFGVPAYVCINKFDLNEKVTAQIEGFCARSGYPAIGRIPFEPAVVRALQEFKTPAEAGIGRVTDAIGDMWDALARDVGSAASQ